MPWSVQILPVKEYTEIAAAALGFTKENGLKLLCLQKKKKHIWQIWLPLISAGFGFNI